ncbi:MAG: glycosyltransferase family 4 protein [Verrucomicrobiaceae bacterium]|nr:glycosyltransferase family 4 protein [Verrucomicrobiaceae bacterium]
MTSVSVNARFRLRPVTGVERFALEVCSRLVSDPDLEVGDVSPSQNPTGLRGHAWEQFVLPRRVPRDAVLFSPCNTGPLALRRQLVVMHDAAVWDYPDGFSASFGHLYRRLLPRLARRAALVATVSEFSRARLAPRLGLPEEDILVLGNAVGEAFSPGNEESGENPEDAPSLLCVGSMDPRKNIPRLVRAWLDLKTARRIPDNAVLKIIGGTNPKNFAALPRVEDASVEWLGRVDDEALIRRYREAAAFIYPSYYEGFGLPPLEAMACGCPVLLSRAASLPEVGGPAFAPEDPRSEGAALYFDPFNEADIGDAIARFFALDPATRDHLRRNALARAGQFSWNAVAEKVSEALQQLDGSPFCGLAVQKNS